MMDQEASTAPTYGRILADVVGCDGDVRFCESEAKRASERARERGVETWREMKRDVTRLGERMKRPRERKEKRRGVR